jgi:hypothetical protein
VEVDRKDDIVEDMTTTVAAARKPETEIEEDTSDGEEGIGIGKFGTEIDVDEGSLKPKAKDIVNLLEDDEKEAETVPTKIMIGPKQRNPIPQPNRNALPTIPETTIIRRPPRQPNDPTPPNPSQPSTFVSRTSSLMLRAITALTPRSKETEEEEKTEQTEEKEIDEITLKETTKSVRAVRSELQPNVVVERKRKTRSQSQAEEGSVWFE